MPGRKKGTQVDENEFLDDETVQKVRDESGYEYEQPDAEAAGYDETGEVTDADAEQSADEGAAWLPVRMLRKAVVDDEENDGYRVVIMQRGGKILDDFYTYQTPGGIVNREVSAVFNMISDRLTERTLRDSKFLPGKNVFYNRLTREISNFLPEVESAE
jgi:hypothetical protein